MTDGADLRLEHAAHAVLALTARAWALRPDQARGREPRDSPAPATRV
jgi:hypothetical protein